jgi:hypothetical protein
MLLFTQSILLRIAEGPAYQPHSVYIWDAIWLAFLAGASAGGIHTQTHTHTHTDTHTRKLNGSEACVCVCVGYSSMPKTHFGRLAVANMIMGMPVIMATMTGMATRAMMLSYDEQELIVN